MTIDREPFYRRKLELKLSKSYGPGRHDPDYELAGHDYPFAYVRWTEQRNIAAFLELVAEGKVTPKRLVSHRFPIDRAEEADQLMERGERHLAILLTYSQEPGSGSIECHIKRTAAVPAANAAGSLSLASATMRRARFCRLSGRVVTSTGIRAGHAFQSTLNERLATAEIHHLKGRDPPSRSRLRISQTLAPSMPHGVR